MKEIQWNLEKDKAWRAYCEKAYPIHIGWIGVDCKKAFYAGYDAGQESLTIREEK